MSKPTYPTHPVTAPQQGGIWQSVKEGFGWGVGTSIARRMFGPSTEPLPAPTHVPQRVTYKSGNVEYEKCLEEAHGDEKACEHLRT